MHNPAQEGLHKSLFQSTSSTLHDSGMNHLDRISFAEEINGIGSFKIVCKIVQNCLDVSRSSHKWPDGELTMTEE